MHDDCRSVELGDCRKLTSDSHHNIWLLHFVEHCIPDNKQKKAHLVSELNRTDGGTVAVCLQAVLESAMLVSLTIGVARQSAAYKLFYTVRRVLAGRACRATA
jgi:hypothetical protein